MNTPQISSFRTFAPLLGSIALLLNAAHGAEIAKLQSSTPALNVGGAWNGGVVPGVGDVMLWNSLYTAPGASTTLSQLGGSLSVLGLKVTNVGGGINAPTTMVGFQDTNSANTLTIGSGGIDMSAATQTLLVQSKVTIGANQNWVIANANSNGNPATLNAGEDLALFAQAAGAAFNLGGNTVTTSGAGAIAFTSGYTLSNGTLNIGNALTVIQGGSNRLTTIDATTTLGVNAGATLRLQSNSGALLSNGAINLNGGTLNLFANSATNTVIANGNLNVLAPSTITITSPANATTALNGNLTGSAALTVTNTAADVARFLSLGGNNSAYAGTITFGGTAGRVSRLTTANSGSAAATWSISTGHTLQINGVTAALGTLNGAGSVSSSSGGSTITVGAGTFSGTLTNGTGTLGLTKITAGTLSLTGTTSNYTGPTNVNAGTLLVAPGALTGTAVTVANGATYAAQTSTAGLLDTPVSVSTGGTMLVRPLIAGSSVTVPSLTSAANGNLTLDTGALGNPAVAPLVATTFSATAGTKLKVLGSNLTPGTFPAIAYTGALGGGGFGALSLTLPFRVTGGLVNSAGSVDVSITGIAKPLWNGTVNNVWNIDNVGDGSAGTANWIGSSGPNTYVEAAVGTDSVTFDDTATGSTSVNLSTVVTPNGVSITNSAKAYTFTGTGRITGVAGLTKSGNGTLTVANTGANNYSGGTTINDGTVFVGDGATAGAGSLGGPVTLAAPATLDLNRPDDFTFANSITGAGTLRKSGANTATLSGAANVIGSVNLAGGTTVFSGGGNLGGAISGAGSLAVGGGTLQLSGADANTFSGTTTITGGALQLNKSAGTNAVTGDITIGGTGTLQLLTADQIPDTATINFTGSSGSAVPTQAFGGETVANVIVNSSVGGTVGGQFIMGTSNSSFTVSNTATVTSGILGVASGGTGTVERIVVNSPNGIIRIAGSGGPSTLNVGSGGITTSGGEIQVKFNTNNQDAVLNLGGDFTATGNVTISNAGYVGGSQNVINLTDTRTFNISAGTTTTVAADLGGPGGLTKTGNGTLQLTALSSPNYTGTTTVSAGTFLTNTTSGGGGSVIVSDAATLGVTVLSAGAAFNAADLTTGIGSKLILATGNLGNPSVPIIANAGAFTINGATQLQLTGVALTTASAVPLISYTSLGGGAGFAGLSVTLPTRMAGTLINNTIDSRIDIDLSVEQARWNGGVNSSWDIDPDGTGATGTLNWKTTITNASTRYFQGPPINTDTANFDDSATGSTVVNLTTALSPIAANVNNSAQTYTFAGPGTLTGTTVLNKTGTGTLILANTAPYNHTGGTIISDGVLQVGDGVTAGAGFLPTTAVTNNAVIALNRPDDFAVSTAINGTGTVQKLNSNTATFNLATTSAQGFDVFGGTLLFSAAANLSGAININAGALQFGAAGTVSGPVGLNAGTLRFGNGGTLSGAVTGAGNLELTGGTLAINGGSPNANTGTTTVSGGTLQLNKPIGTDAVGGDIVITGTGVLSLVADEQIPDTATITFTGSSGDSLPAPAAPAIVGHETVTGVVVNSSVGGAGGGQFIMRNGFTALGTAVLNSGILGVASGNTATVNAINITAAPGSNGILRIAASGGPSTLNVGPGGITASGGEIQVKFNTNNQDGVINLSGDFTATGNVAITNAGYTGASLNVVNLLGGDRTFNIAGGTTTTVAPAIAGADDLIKTGTGTLTLNGAQSYAILNTQAGTTNLNKALGSGASSIVSAGATNISVSQTLASLDIGDGGVVTLGAPAPAPAPDFGATADILGGNNEALGVNAAVQAVPEPGSAALLLLGALRLLTRRSRKS